jgi:small subunit ribosomal protein S20
VPIKKSAYKELRKAKKRHFVNITRISELRTLAKKFERLLQEKKGDEAKVVFAHLTAKIDKAASRGVIHKNTASRKKMRFAHRLNALAKA